MTVYCITAALLLMLCLLKRNTVLKKIRTNIINLLICSLYAHTISKYSLLEELIV